MRYLLIRIFIVIGAFICTITTYAQNDTVFNRTDAQGLKQGYWKVKNQNGTLKYTAFFKDNKPSGLMKRYFSDNTLMAELYFYPNSAKIRAKLYFQAGPLAAEGIYSQKDVKDSTWNYYSYYTKSLSSRETYVNGKKYGIAYTYYSTGRVAEEREWKNDISNGIWRQYYENGIMRFSTTFVNDKRNGTFVVNYPDNKPEWKGTYKDDKRDGKWIHYDINGKEIKIIEYKDGVASNAEQLQEEEQKELDAIEKQKGKIPEPDETNIMPGARQ
jgi:antitoxin component YwqK of YwqJK toxin-antitoxin module